MALYTKKDYRITKKLIIKVLKETEDDEQNVTDEAVAYIQTLNLERKIFTLLEKNKSFTIYYIH